MNITGRTKICGIIGDPVEHSMSPAMHNTAFERRGIDYVYLPFRVKREDVGKAIDGMRALNIRGLNVTIPHKVAVMPFLDEIDALAEKIGAVNTIVNDFGFLKGYNTDAAGFLRALLEKGIEPRGKSVVLLGAGGAARAISFVLAERGANLVLINRTHDKAVECAARVAQAFSCKIAALELTPIILAEELRRADILVNATSVGMSPHTDETPVPASLLSPRLTVCDIVYNPIRTRLLREAGAAGAKTVDGVDMLVWQGAMAFEKWTGIDAPVDCMREVVIKRLG